MKFRVELARRAKQDFDDILTWIERRSPEGAEGWARRWQETVNQLSIAAETCMLAPESDRHDSQIYQIVFSTRHGLAYRALFQINGDLVSVITIRGPAGNIYNYNPFVFFGIPKKKKGEIL